MPQYQLATDGDRYEIDYYPLFIQTEFPSYEVFWQKFIVPLTRRPTDIHTKNDTELAQMGRTPNDICIAQLHYSVLRHLIRAYDIQRTHTMGVDHAFFGLTAVCGAHDVAFELLERFRSPARYDPWAVKKRGNILGGKDAQTAWKKADNFPLQNFRDYRNNLMHGRMLPGLVVEDVTYLPTVGKELQYLDWRKITNLPTPSQFPRTDFSKVADILSAAWQGTIQYLESRWQTHLLPNIS
jgi:hypothetical protein